MSALEIHQFICRSDNFCVLLHDREHHLTAAIDAPDAETIEHELARRGWSLTHIFVTHHHHDHTAGNKALKAQTGCTIFGAQTDAARIPAIDKMVTDGQTLTFGGHAIEVLATPGHTTGHVSYFIPGAKIAFTGDTLFSLGCGRLFEGTAAQMYHSLQRLAALPPDTQIYCGHEYTLNNGEFALEVDPENTALAARVAEVRDRRRARQPSLPVSLATELATNPFLRADVPALAKNIGLTAASPLEVFTELRRRKDNF